MAAALKGIAIGFITPFCTYSAVPMLVGMRQAGVTPAGYVAFIMAAPVLDPVLFGALIIIVGLKVAIVYLSVAFVAALSLALIADGIGMSKHLKPITIAPSDSNCNQSTTQAWRGYRIEFPMAVVASLALLRSVGVLLLIGVLLGVGITALVSEEAVATLTSQSFDIPIAAAIGTPIHTTTALLVPLANSLLAVGVGIGAIVSLTIAGAGATIPEFILLMRLFHTGIICVFFVYVFLVAVLGGYLSQLIVG